MTTVAPLAGSWSHAGLRLAFDRTGAGQPLVFGHGLGGDRAQVAALLGDLDGVDRLTPESRGHGESALGDPDDLLLGTFAQDAIALVASLGWNRAVWGGISMGATVALHAAVLRPDVVRGLLLVRPAWTTGAPPAHLAVLGRLGRWMQTLSPSAARQALLGSPEYTHILQTSPDNAASLLGHLAAVKQQIRATLLQRISAQPLGLAPASLARLGLPALIVATEDDVMHPVAVAQDLAAVLPDARLVVVTSKSRDPLRNRAETLAAVRTFLGKLP